MGEISANTEIRGNVDVANITVNEEFTSFEILGGTVWFTNVSGVVLRFQAYYSL